MPRCRARRRRHGGGRGPAADAAGAERRSPDRHAGRAGRSLGPTTRSASACPAWSPVMASCGPHRTSTAWPTSTSPGLQARSTGACGRQRRDVRGARRVAPRRRPRLERHGPRDVGHRHRRRARRRRSASAWPQRVRRRVRPHGRRPRRPAVRVRSTRMLGALRVGVGAGEAGAEAAVGRRVSRGSISPTATRAVRGEHVQAAREVTAMRSR